MTEKGFLKKVIQSSPGIHRIRPGSPMDTKIYGCSNILQKMAQYNQPFRDAEPADTSQLNIVTEDSLQL